jgi:hypothetical protein
VISMNQETQERTRRKLRQGRSTITPLLQSHPHRRGKHIQALAK